MAGEWQKIHLTEVTTIASGKRPAVVSKEPTSSCQIPVIGGGGPSGFTETALYNGLALITGRVGTLGKLFAPSGPVWPSDNALVILPRDSGTDAKFLRYALQLVIAEAAGMNRGAANPLITQGDLGRLVISHPPLSEQHAIAHILGTLDDKIELNRRMSETLEAMARALFKSWFVDFDPVRAKLNPPSPPGRGAGGEGSVKGAERLNPPLPAALLAFARQLRGTATDAETLMWRLLRDRRVAGAKFRRQHPFPPYILDFYCHEHRLAIELDGGHHGEEAHQSRDAQRSEHLARYGIRVLRFWNNEVLRQTEAVMEAIYQAVSVGGEPSPPTPLPQGEGSGGLPQALADLFPARLVDSELGEIPEGWEVAPLTGAIEVNPTRSLRKGVVAPYLDMANMPTRGHSADDVVDREFGSGMRFVNGDTLLARITPCLENGKTAFVDFLKGGQVGWGSTEYIVLRPKPPLPEEFAYCLARSDEFREFAIQSMTGSSGRQRVPAESLSHYLLCLPPENVAKQFGAAIKPLFARASAAARESRTLAALRDTLLPKLISGELRVDEAEAFLQARGL